MTAPVETFPFVEKDPAVGTASRMPYVPLTLSLGARSVHVAGLLDTGATINVMPQGVGLSLGAVWEQQPTPVRLTGNLAAVDARVLIVSAAVGRFASVQLAFAWASVDGLPVLLGQINFFEEFDVCFFRGRGVVEVRTRGMGTP